MRNAIFQYEVKTWLRSPFFYLLTGSFFLFSLVTMLGTGGFFDGPVNSNQPVNLLNSPYSLSSISFLFAKFLLFVVAILGGFSLYRDYRNKTHAIIYSFPISKSFYLNGKLGSVLFLISMVSILTLSGIWLGEIILGTANPKIGTNSSLGYILALCLYLLPTLIIIGVVVFVAVGISRNIFSGFIVIICFVLFQLILENVFFEQKALLALFDPFGQNAFYLATNDWGFNMQNSNTLPVKGIIIWNRIFWLVIAFIIYSVFFRKFDFQYNSVWQFNKAYPKDNGPAVHLIKQPELDQDIRYEFSTKARIKCLVQLMIYDFKNLIKNWMFLVLCFFGAATVFFIQLKVTNTGEFNLFPFTRLFIGAPLSIYSLIVILSTFLFSGLLINKARRYKMNLMLDATPIMDWQLLLSKIGAISLVQVVQLLLFIIIGISIQIINGYYNFEFGLYFFHLFVLVFPVLMIWNVTSQFVHTLVPNLFLGLFILAGLWLGAQSLEQLGIQTDTLKYNFLPALEYSDFNGYGHQLKGYLLLIFYWLLFGLFLAFGIFIIWKRGSMSSVKERFTLAKSKMNKPLSLILILLSINFLWLGHKIYTLENIAKNSSTVANPNRTLKEYKKAWERYSRITQPKIVDVDLKIDLFPREENFTARGIYKLVNQSGKIIDTVFVRTGFDEITELNWNGKAQLLKEDVGMKSYLFKLTNSLNPGDSVELSFNIRNTPNIIFSRNSNVLKNGTYLRQDILPRLGYQFIDHELPLTDSLVNSNNYFHRDAKYVSIHTTISTSKDQIAIGPGELITENKEGKRKIYEYNTPKPVKFNFSFHSAQFETIEEQYSGVDIQLYYLKGHHFNTKLMLDGLKASFDYNTKRFGEYPYQQLRIIEFPNTEARYSATLTSNNIPVSEILFNMNTEAMNKKINLPFYVMAHELTHEWFGNTVMPADAEGAKMLTESITEYITLCIYQEHLGEELADNFLNAQRNRYSRGQKREKGNERPLNKVLSHQEYLSYGKGAIAFNTISNSIGKDKFNAILQSYLLKYQSQSDYFPTTNNFIQLLKSKTDKEEHQLIDHWLTQTNTLN
jgi:ABC-2 type transport system permease protein